MSGFQAATGGSYASVSSTASIIPAAKRMRGVLQKRSADGSWKPQVFSLHKHKLYYDDLRSLQRDHAATPHSLDLLDVVKTERVGLKLYLWVDDRRKHQLREATDDYGTLCPSLDEWEQAIHERIAIARQRRKKREPLTPTVEALDESPAAAADKPAFFEGRVLEDKPDDDDDDEDSALDHDQQFYRTQIVEFYQRHNPEKVADVDALILKYAEIGISEKDLLSAIQNKYDKIKYLK
mmetsp:Transcript_2544/g.7918  ORF Transcript_2544/g.7918 Transcript_2544/m.7918 type:complete len:237 (-) Transcript_2544:88-798(-)